MTRHEADRVHEASGITFEFAGHLVWGNPRLAGNALHGDVEAWRCGRCNALVAGGVDAEAVHAGEHVEHDVIMKALDVLGRKLDNVSPGAFKPTEPPAKGSKAKVAGVGTPQAQLVNDHAREQRVERYREAIADGAAWRETATVREVSPAQETAQQLRADGLPE